MPRIRGNKKTKRERDTDRKTGRQADKRARQYYAKKKKKKKMNKATLNTVTIKTMDQICVIINYKMCLKSNPMRLYVNHKVKKVKIGFPLNIVRSQG